MLNSHDVTRTGPAMLQLNPPLPLETPKGAALAHFLIDYGPEHDLCWVCFQDETGECWTWRNREVRAPKNITMGRRTADRRPKVDLRVAE